MKKLPEGIECPKGRPEYEWNSRYNGMVKLTTLDCNILCPYYSGNEKGIVCFWGTAWKLLIPTTKEVKCGLKKIERVSHKVRQALR